MATALISNFWTYTTDKLGDVTLVVLDEMKFWGEVVTEFMEYDQSSSDKYVDEHREEIR